jgi:hypothetical protein
MKMIHEVHEAPKVAEVHEVHGVPELKDVDDILRLIAQQLLNDSVYGHQSNAIGVFMAKYFVNFIETINAYSGLFKDDILFNQALMMKDNPRDGPVIIYILRHDLDALLRYLMDMQIIEMVPTFAFTYIRRNCLKMLYENPATSSFVKDHVHMIFYNSGTNLRTMSPGCAVRIRELVDYCIEQKIDDPAAIIQSAIYTHTVHMSFIVEMIDKYRIAMTLRIISVLLSHLNHDNYEYLWIFIEKFNDICKVIETIVRHDKCTVAFIRKIDERYHVGAIPGLSISAETVYYENVIYWLLDHGVHVH